MRAHLWDYDGELPGPVREWLALEAGCTMGDLVPEMLEDGPEAYLGVLGDHPEPLMEQLRMVLRTDASLCRRVHLFLASSASKAALQALERLGVGGLHPLPRDKDAISKTFEAIAAAKDHAPAVEDDPAPSEMLSRLHVFSYDFLNQFPLGALFLSTGGKVVWANQQAFRLLLGRHSGKLVGEGYPSVLSGGIADAIREYWPIISSPECIEPLVITAQNRSKMLECTLSPIVSKKGVVSGVGMLFTDQSFQNDLLGLRAVMLQQLSRSLLSGVDELNEGIRLAQENAAGSALEDTSRFLNRLYTVTRTLDERASDMLELATEMTTSGVGARRFDLSEVLKDIVAGFHSAVERKGLTIDAQGLDEVCPVAMNSPRLLLGTCFNLLRNTIRYARHGTTVGMSIHRSPAHIEVRLAHRPERQLTADEIETIIRNQAKQGLVHLGNILNVRSMIEIIEMHGGSLRMTPTDSETLEFHLRLPAHEGEIDLNREPKVGRAGEETPFLSLLAMENDSHLRRMLEAAAARSKTLLRHMGSVEELADTLEHDEDGEIYLNLANARDEVARLLKGECLLSLACARLSSLTVTGGQAEELFAGVLFADSETREAVHILTHRQVAAYRNGGGSIKVASLVPEEALPKALRAALTKPHSPFTFALLESPEDDLETITREQPSFFVGHYLDERWMELARALKTAPETHGIALVAVFAERSEAFGRTVRFLGHGDAPTPSDAAVASLSALLKGT